MDKHDLIENFKYCPDAVVIENRIGQDYRIVHGLTVLRINFNIWEAHRNIPFNRHPFFHDKLVEIHATKNSVEKNQDVLREAVSLFGQARNRMLHFPSISVDLHCKPQLFKPGTILYWPYYEVFCKQIIRNLTQPIDTDVQYFLLSDQSMELGRFHNFTARFTIVKDLQILAYYPHLSTETHDIYMY